MHRNTKDIGETQKTLMLSLCINDVKAIAITITTQLDSAQGRAS